MTKLLFIAVVTGALFYGTWFVGNRTGYKSGYGDGFFEARAHSVGRAVARSAPEGACDLEMDTWTSNVDPYVRSAKFDYMFVTGCEMSGIRQVKVATSGGMGGHLRIVIIPNRQDVGPRQVDASRRDTEDGPRWGIGTPDNPLDPVVSLCGGGPLWWTSRYLGGCYLADKQKLVQEAGSRE